MRIGLLSHGKTSVGLYVHFARGCDGLLVKYTLMHVANDMNDVSIFYLYVLADTHTLTHTNTRTATTRLLGSVRPRWLA